MSEPPYIYRGSIVRWVDGDTVDVALDLGFYITVNVRLRLYGVNTPERGQLNYREAIVMAERLAPVVSSVIVRTYKVPEKYGRFLAHVLTPDGRDVGDQLVQAGLAVPYFGGTK